MISTYRNVEYEKTIFGFIPIGKLKPWDINFPLSTKQDVKNAVDFFIHNMETFKIQRHEELINSRFGLSQILNVINSDKQNNLYI